MAGTEKRQLSLETIKTWYWDEVIGLQLSHYFPLTLINFSDGSQDLVAGSPAKEDQVFSIWAAFPEFSEYFPTPRLWWLTGSLRYKSCVGPLWAKLTALASSELEASQPKRSGVGEGFYLKSPRAFIIT